MAEIITGPLTEDEEESNIITGPLSEQESGEGEEEGEPGEQYKEFRSVSSTMVAEVAYNPEGETLEVLFQNGHEGSYACDLATFEALLEAPSIGAFMHQNFL